MNNSIKENLISFSQSWESYVEECKVEENGKELGSLITGADLDNIQTETIDADDKS